MYSSERDSERPYRDLVVSKSAMSHPSGLKTQFRVISTSPLMSYGRDVGVRLMLNLS